MSLLIVLYTITKLILIVLCTITQLCVRACVRVGACVCVRVCARMRVQERGGTYCTLYHKYLLYYLPKGQKSAKKFPKGIPPYPKKSRFRVRGHRRRMGVVP